MNYESKSMFIGPKNIKIFGPDNQYWVPEPTKWNRDLYYSTPMNMIEVNSLEQVLDLNNLDYVERNLVYGPFGVGMNSVKRKI